jgi:outer membrane immunogenic protein
MERARLMRWVICAVVVLALTPPAFAQDADDILRGTDTVGPATFTKWSGFYFGGQMGFTGGNPNFQGTTQSPLAFALRDSVIESTYDPSEWQLLGSDSGTATSYGAFVGYNTQWQDLVLGGEINYSLTNTSFIAPSTPLARSFTIVDPVSQAETLYNLTADASATLRLIDYASLRARAGWIVGTNFLPYAFGGFALGRADFTESTAIGGPTATTVPEIIPTANGGTTTFTPTPVLPCNGTETCSVFSAGSNNSANATLMYGVDVGAGIDVALMSNVFLRGEFEYVHFFPYNGIVVDIATARIGAGFKF